MLVIFFTFFLRPKKGFASASIVSYTAYICRVRDVSKFGKFYPIKAQQYVRHIIVKQVTKTTWFTHTKLKSCYLQATKHCRKRSAVRFAAIFPNNKQTTTGTICGGGKAKFSCHSWMSADNWMATVGGRVGFSDRLAHPEFSVNRRAQAHFPAWVEWRAS